MPTITSQHFSFAYYLSLCLQPVRLAYQPPASSTFLSEQISHQQPASSTLLSEQTSTSHQPPANRTGRWFLNNLHRGNKHRKKVVKYLICFLSHLLCPTCNNIGQIPTILQ
jgi:hypothetical protein